MSGQSIIPTQATIGEITLKASNKVPSHKGHNKARSDHQLQEQRRKKLRWKIHLPTKKVVLFILWRRQETYNKDVPSHDPETKGNS
jgi:hypothetical protein